MRENIGFPLEKMEACLMRNAPELYVQGRHSAIQ